ncbi:MAG: DUF5681 domain-containing protein, partial [Xanthobacteraceae bacterium]
MARNKEKRQATGDYPTGYCRPPAQHRFRPGQSGNPTGERKAGRVKTPADELKEIAATKVTIRDGDKTRKVSLITANLLAHGLSGAKGDARSAALFLNQVQKMGLYDHQGSGDLLIRPSGNSRPSDLLLENLDPSLLSRDEQVELSQLAALINRDGSIWVLSA